MVSKFRTTNSTSTSKTIKPSGRALVRDYGRRLTAYDGDRKYVRAIFRLYDDKDADSTESIKNFVVCIY